MDDPVVHAPAIYKQVCLRSIYEMLRAKSANPKGIVEKFLNANVSCLHAGTAKVRQLPTFHTYANRTVWFQQLDQCYHHIQAHI